MEKKALLRQVDSEEGPGMLWEPTAVAYHARSQKVVLGRSFNQKISRGGASHGLAGGVQKT